jgi:large subunit ribosomal protein L7/L12
MADAARLVGEIRLLLAAGRKIEAIRRYREVTGADLAEATKMVEAIARNAPPSQQGVTDAAFEDEIVGLLQGEKTLEAVKRYRKRTGLGLKEARDAVEALAARRGVTVASPSGCFGVVLFLLLLSATVLAWAGQ